MGCTSNSSLLLSFLFRALVLVGLFCLVAVGSFGGGTRGATTLSTNWSAERLKHEGDVLGGEKPVDHAELDINYMSKRRVPNGPDPIHNRRAGNSGRPPGRA
ncbi:hypothetical protein L6164_020695 [Bauhinia variegata]|uniref:Uncharacterized protein n=1 Tax=Bauhinia variegata TaxID=167791 RepID=A0ACB9MZC4_BAUVA|nr:hypothetical protein L6164_020695 [Bauhinia variegata]